MHKIYKYLLLAIFLIFWSCEGNKSAKNKQVTSEHYEQEESISTEAETAEIDIQTIVRNLDKEKNIEIPKAYYSVLGLEDDETHYLLIPSKKIDDFNFFGLYRSSMPATPILSFFELSFFIIRNSEMKQKMQFEIGLYNTLDVSMHHEHFICIRDWVTEYEENENGIMEEKHEPYEELSFISLLKGEPKMIKDLKKDDLRIARNYIFARYGRKFQSVDLQEYFTQFEWYKAKSENVDDQLTDMDKELLKQLVAIENDKP